MLRHHEDEQEGERGGAAAGLGGQGGGDGQQVLHHLHHLLHLTPTAHSSEAGDFFHKLEVKELSRESVSPHAVSSCSVCPPQARPTSHTLYFADGLRRIDMILVFELDPGNGKKTQAREAFEKHLRLQGLETETESPSVSGLKHGLLDFGIKGSHCLIRN